MVPMPFPALVLCFFITAGESLNFTIEVEHSQINATVGDNVTFAVQPSDKISSGSWTFNGKTVCQWIDQLVSLDNSYKLRAELDTSNGSLLLKSVEKSDSGEYLVNMVPTSGSQNSATVTLRVTEPPSPLAGGAIARNVIGVTAGVVLVCALIF
ncbi:V-set and transmembrane domain-containing protein 5-like [Hemitrygon akajei]|uniref:V-set and transmembrane domain-containing protein 5-like n=1 Tax=Hemitrygon akajei TaxID=2704970 RepID=UPI003BF98311